MKIISQNKSKNFSLLLILAGMGALWLSFIWYKSTSSNDGLAPGRFATFEESPYTLFYYAINSILLIFSGLLLHVGRFKFYSTIALILAFSVTISLLIFPGNGNSWNLFLYTVFMGMTWGLPSGGTILVPLFLYGVYWSAFQAGKHLEGKLIYTE